MSLVDWSSPWRLLLLLTSCFLSEAASTTNFPRDLEPISAVALEQSCHYPSFQGLPRDNDTLRLGLGFQKMLRLNHMLYITARDHVFAMNLTTAVDSLIPQLQLMWTSRDVSTCTVRGKNSDECYNYIKVLVPRNDETLFACGTNAFHPTCREYKMATLDRVGEDVGGQARCPFESHQSGVGLFAGGDFYSATTTDFLASDTVIYRSLGGGRPVLRTVKYDSKWLREPHFQHAIDYGNYVYFFLSELAVEYTALGKVVFSRVARVCKNDNGGSPRVLEKHWTSFLKARLNCSVPGDSFFYFDVLQSLTNVLQLNRRPAVVGVFTTQANSIPGSAVCAFYMDDIEKVFHGKFKQQRSSDSSWSAVPDEQVPRPRPGACAGDGSAADFKSSVQFPDETLTFIKSHPLMDEAVPSIGDRPCFTRTSSRSRLTQILVDVLAGPFKDRTVMFLGSDHGRVLKVLASTHPNDSFGSKLLEDVDVYNPAKCNVQGQEDRRVLGLELDKDRHALFVAFSSCVIRTPLSRCVQHGPCKKACLASRDPYCIWLRTGSCANVAPGFKAGFEQDIEGDHLLLDDGCQGDVLVLTGNQESGVDSAFGVHRLPDLDQQAAAQVHFTLLIACVLVAFFLGAILSGFMMSCYCGRTAALRSLRLAKDPEASLPHAMSLRSLAKLSGLFEGAPKEDNVDASVPEIYSCFIPNGRALSPGGPELSLSQTLSQADGELSGLPTPDSTPRLQQHQYGSASGPGFVAVLENCYPAQAFPSSRYHGISLSDATAHGEGASSTSLQPPEERAAAADVSALDELLKHIHEVSASGTGGIKVLTCASSPFPGRRHHHRDQGLQTDSQHHSSSCGGRRHQQQIPGTEAAAYSATSSSPSSNPTSAASSSTTQIPERLRGSAVCVTRHHSQRHVLIKTASGGGARPCHHSFNQRGHARFLGRTNANSSPAGSRRGSQRVASACLTRQHSYSEGPHLRRPPLVRRAASLKPQIPPKPSFLPNAAVELRGGGASDTVPQDKRGHGTEDTVDSSELY